MSLTFDTEKFITEIQKRPPLWDMSLDSYTNTELKKKLWDELVVIFGPSTIKTEEAEEMCHNLQKKWKNIRDCYTRELRRIKTLNSGSAVKRKGKYIYFDHLQFLQTSTTANEAKESTAKVVVEAPPPIAESHPVVDNNVVQQQCRKRKKDEDAVDKELIDILNKSLKRREEIDNQQVDEDKMFLLSLLQDLKQVPEHLKLRTKIELMVVLDKAKMGLFEV